MKTQELACLTRNGYGSVKELLTELRIKDATDRNDHLLGVQRVAAARLWVREAPCLVKMSYFFDLVRFPTHP